MPKSVVEELECWKWGFGNHHTADVWSSCLIVLCVPFREMDLCTFDGIESFSVDKALQWV